MNNWLIACESVRPPGKTSTYLSLPLRFYIAKDSCVDNCL